MLCKDEQPDNTTVNIRGGQPVAWVACGRLGRRWAAQWQVGQEAKSQEAESRAAVWSVSTKQIGQDSGRVWG